MKASTKPSRRSFIGKTMAVGSAAALSGFAFSQTKKSIVMEEGVFMIGPKKGYTPHVGTLVSMLENMSFQVKRTIEDLTIEELDYQYDETSNTIGALILHIISSEKFHQIGTLQERPLNEEEMKFWGPARKLGDPASKQIKGHDINYYLEVMDKVRQDSLSALQQKDDDWLMSIDPIFSTNEKPVNKYWRWFHACEHMSNHNGQIKFLKSRLPAKQ